MANEKRLIDANRIKYELNILYCDSRGEIREGVDDAIHIVNLMPTVDAVEVKHGRWIKPKRLIITEMKCSVCHKQYLLCEYNYCPNCGAKMDGDGNA